MKVWLAWLFVLLGGLLAALGVIFVVMYLWEAVIARLGEPDQSLVFWYLPVLFLGLIAGIGGMKLFFLGMRHINKYAE